MHLADRVAIVTGGVSGIGAAIAARFRNAGARVVTADISPGADHRTNIADPDSVAALVAFALETHGRIDCLVNAAGIGRDIPFLDTTAEEFDRIVSVNLRGTFLVGQACARAMVAAGRGAIVNIASVSGLRGNIGRAAYGASKGGVIVLSQVMATELAERGVRVNVIAPGPVDTPMVAAMHDAEIRASWTRATPMARYATPEEVAGAALFLCSEEAGYITGQVLAVDGGLTATSLARR
jgi:NAD(P)-dependent dehydrogenase (short-subunit alcohol dehydrogenase family)